MFSGMLNDSIPCHKETRTKRKCIMADEKKPAEEKKVLTVEGLGNVVDKGKNTYGMTDKDLYKFYEEHGVPKAKDVLNAIGKAREDLIIAGAGFLKDRVVETKEEQTLKCGTGTGKVTISVSGEKTVHDRLNKETKIKYGVVTVKVAEKIPESLKAEDAILGKFAKEIEKAFK